MKKLFPVLVASLFVLCCNSAFYAQINITVQPATDLVQQVLVGAGVQVSNITSGGDPSQIGRFTAGNSVNLSVNTGVVMTTGNIPGMMDPNDAFNFIGGPSVGTISSASLNGINQTGDPDLNAIISSFGADPTTNNVAVIEFDFVPSGDSVAFNYVFASEEYNGFVCSQFFDVFGFFISGPGINGPYTGNAQNIAIVPGTNPALPVSMNTINSGISDGGIYCPPGGLNNQNLFVDNSTAQNFGPYGFTETLTAQATVQCGETYHIKLVIANGFDQGYDSWVFLEAESFSSSVPNITIANLLPDSAVIEGCIDGQLVFRRNISSDTLSIPVVYGGEAQPGVDYTGLPDTLVFLPGVDSLYYVLTPLSDNQIEGTNGYEDLIISFEVINQCGDTIFVDRVIKIRDPYVLNIQTPDDTLACPTANYTAQAIVSGGYEPYVYNWAFNNLTTPSINVPITESTTFNVNITDALDCPFSNYNETVVVTLNYDSLSSEPSTATICSGDTIDISASPIDGLGPFTYNWVVGGNTQTIEVTTTDTTIYAYTITDFCNITVADTVTVFVPEYDPISITPNDTTICSKDGEATLIVMVEGGAGGYTYEWSGPGTITPTNDSVSTANPTTSTNYFIMITDQCENIGMDTLEVNVINCDLKASNAYSPNGDGKNDFFTIENIDKYPGSTVYLFTRWGKKVFEQTDYKNDWAGGDEITSGTYFYIVEPNDGTEQLKGYVTIFKE